jgi:hypothetical protein
MRGDIYVSFCGAAILFDSRMEWQSVARRTAVCVVNNVAIPAVWHLICYNSKLTMQIKIFVILCKAHEPLINNMNLLHHTHIIQDSNYCRLQ